MRGFFAFALTALLIQAAPVRAAPDCVQGERDLAAAKARITASADDEATVLLNQAADECPSYEAYETLAEHLAASDSPRDHGSAVDAFINAQAHTVLPKEQAQSLFQYAALLNRSGDPQNAYPLIQKAQALDPNRPAIKKLAADIQAQVQHPKVEEITRALRFSLYKPVKGLVAGGPAVNIPINFETDSTNVDEQTRPNLNTLADALAGPEFAGKTFSLIGHSDPRGDPRYNLNLSRQRAATISEQIVELRPELKGRIQIDGRGAREPIDLGTDEEALRRNRRLQVIAN